MRKLILQVQISVDGYIAGVNGEMDWMAWNWGDDINTYVNNLTEPVDTILLGRKLAEGFIPHWTAAFEVPESREESRKMAETEKVVFTRTLSESKWERTTLATGTLEDEVLALKRKEGKDMIAYGGSTFVSALISKGLIDEYHFFINPTLLGPGMPIFHSIAQRQSLELVKSQAFDCGIVVVHYKVKQ
jgi:dihydrofolate reductase